MTISLISRRETLTPRAKRVTGLMFLPRRSARVEVFHGDVEAQHAVPLMPYCLHERLEGQLLRRRRFLFIPLLVAEGITI